MNRRGEAPRAGWFWFLAVLLMFFLFSASAPSPLYAIYQARFGFSSITLTAIYAVYAGAALVSLLFLGRLSDHVGRKRVVSLALVVQIAGLVAFIVADDVTALYVGRFLQGFGTGLATGAISAWILDLQPPERPGLGGLIGGISPIAGLGAGALVASVLVQYAPYPLHLVFWLLTAIFGVALAAMPVAPDAVTRRPGALASLRPRVGVPEGARSLFVALAPSLVALWALGGLYLSLGPSLAVSLLDTPNRIAGGIVIASLMGAAAVGSALARASDPRSALVRGSLALIAGVGVTLVGVATRSLLLLYVGSAVAGLGFGPSFSGIFRTLAPLAPPEKRGELVASVWVVVYLSFSVPAIVAGIAVSTFSLVRTTYVFGITVITLAAVTTVAVSRRRAVVESVG